MRFPPSGLPVLRVRDVIDLVALLPHLLGFQPRESLVAVALRGPRDRVRFTLRVDLPPASDRAAVAEECARRMTLADAEAVLLFVVTEQTFARDGPLPESELVAAVRAAVVEPVRAALHVGAGRVTCYDARAAGCCPVEGTAFDPDGPEALRVAAAHVLGGRVVHADREAVVRSVAAAQGEAANVFRNCAEQVLATDTLAGDRYAQALAAALASAGADGGAPVGTDDIAVLALGWRDPLIRDEMLGRLASDDAALDAVVREVAARSAPAYDASAAAVLAWSAYLHGEGVVAFAAVERCLATDPAHSLGRLLDEMLAAQVPPEVLREASARFAPGVS